MIAIITQRRLAGVRARGLAAPALRARGLAAPALRARGLAAVAMPATFADGAAAAAGPELKLATSFFGAWAR